MYKKYAFNMIDDWIKAATKSERLKDEIAKVVFDHMKPQAEYELRCQLF